MDDLLLEMLKTIDPALLTEVVRKARRDPHLKIQDWIVEPLGVGGSGLCVFRLSGTYAGQPWAVVAKHFERPAEEEGSGDANSDWKKKFSFLSQVFWISYPLVCARRVFMEAIKG